jgi:hypothetical protein
VRTRTWRSGRSLRIQRTTALHPNFSSANSKSVINDCLEASGNRIAGNATYRMLLAGCRTVSQMLNVCSVICNFKVIRDGWFKFKIFFTTSLHSSSDAIDDASSQAISEKSMSE